MANLVKQAESQAPGIDPFRTMREWLRWDPFREMAPRLGAIELEGWNPSFEVRENKEGFVFRADVPGVKREDLEVSVVGNRLQIMGKREMEKETKEDTFYAFERAVAPELTWGDALWHAIISVTTIGYGDYSAQTTGGRLGTIVFIILFGLTTFAGNILTMLAIAAATDYGIFLFGRYKEARYELLPIAHKHGVNLKVTEVPPGPPVLSTMVAEVYGPDREGRRRVAEQVKEVFLTTEGIVDVDWMVEDPAPLTEYVVNQEKAAAVGITPEHITRTLRVALNGAEAGLLHVEQDRSEVPLLLQVERTQRSRNEELQSIKLHGSQGQLVPLGELINPVERKREAYIYHKNLQPVTYVVGEVAGSEESPVYGILNMNERLKDVVTPSGVELAVMSTHMPENSQEYGVKWDGEWHITYEVFRDMGAAFGVVVLLIYVLVVGWFGSFITPLIIMAPIPLTLIGILPGHAILGTFFTATSMIGFIALSGIVVRNSILLVDFINQEIRAGEPLEEAVMKAGAVRFRPITLTALALVVGAGVIYLDPIFQGLAVSLIFGVIASTALTLIIIPLLYYIYLKFAGTQDLMDPEEQ